MKTFKQFITEELVPKVYRNASVDVIHNIAQNSKYKTAKFVITKNNHVHASDADHYIHTQIHSMAGEDRNSDFTRGYYTITPKGAFYAAHSQDKDFYLPALKEHPIFQKFEKKGAKRGVMSYAGNGPEQIRSPKEGENLFKPLSGPHGIFASELKRNNIK